MASHDYVSLGITHLKPKKKNTDKNIQLIIAEESKKKIRNC